ncbi:hypothetical protein MJO28_008107 [Puccinia striiformis f. sp. tritici]|uniref:Protein arginine methyltransferase NDUFAF7 n=3 Tax=Puccinia striiformis TaxID=27350 RepID=A0A0L0VFB5_9BASI|nr:hypothetical protein Pst134EA_015831 [Puccinia striiformis f. sp. tritici]KAI9602462.1 hypothetical protein H4Q26_001751 [Puccinia striiformis f. sp. tritici PST-130]KNE97960.1 hypothetical protein PSTG_08637 [Puccinia striiformis f. sp. tritici PST-78]POV96310.1 hypothetical protein PSTT_15731 [Puccinia striiformis]KAH9463746.1 hypothetical protein Pst134EA_015831 [Puccinia striiformis f. sp. tritici]KAI7949286.1 hypothetical protein MJO28_008107 [Puccinia striiformis f. sp. tritici]
MIHSTRLVTRLSIGARALGPGRIQIQVPGRPNFCTSVAYQKGLSESKPGKKVSTQPTNLLEIINQQILASGPNSVPIWMKLCLHHPTLGYYSRTDRSNKADPFGKQGDFITSPEISQVFGELIAIWLISRWQAAGCPERARIIELGPGRGTLMADIVRTFKSIKAFNDVDFSIHFIENSQFMRDLQEQKLSPFNDLNGKVCWFDRIEQVGKVDDQWTMVIGHEFFDALPVHIFQKTPMGFREVMIDINNADMSPTDKSLRFALSPGPTLASKMLISDEHQKLPVGAKLEISPSADQIAGQISQLLKSDAGGTGLIVDYGADHHFAHSLRGFYQHQIVDPLSRPGLTDITANVDFASLKRAMYPNIQTYGPITQRQFLLSMGIEVRTKRLNQSSSSTEDSSQRLISPLGMGEQYKFLGFENSPGHLSSTEAPREVYPFIAAKGP